jgi:hypothetical protein
VKYPFKPLETGLECGYGFDYRLIFALEFLKSHPLINAIPDGEDSAGRQKLRLQTPEESVARVIAMADALVSTAETRGWIQAVSKEDALALITEVKTAQRLADERAWDFKKLQADR